MPLLLTAAVAVLSLAVETVEAVDSFDYGDCEKRSGASAEAVRNFRHHVPQMDAEGKCFVDCVYKLNGVIDNDQVLLDRLDRYYPNPRVTSDCLKSVSSLRPDTCELAAALNSCIEIKIKAARVLNRIVRTRRNRMQPPDDEMAVRSYYYGDDTKNIPAFPTQIPPVPFAEADPVSREEYTGKSVPYQTWRRARSRQHPMAAYMQRRSARTYQKLFGDD